MIIVSDTTILSSLAAAQALPHLHRLFARSTVSIPPAVRDELQVAVARGRVYLATLMDAIIAGNIPVLALTEDEQVLASTMPRKLNAGECEALAICQQRRIPLLRTDRRAVRYGQAHGMDVVDLATILRLFWTHQIATQADVDQMLRQMEHIERLMLTDTQRAAIFAPQRRR